MLVTMRDGPGEEEEEEVRSIVSLRLWAFADTSLVSPMVTPGDPRELQKGEDPMLNASSGRSVQRGGPERAEG